MVSNVVLSFEQMKGLGYIKAYLVLSDVNVVVFYFWLCSTWKL